MFLSSFIFLNNENFASMASRCTKILFKINKMINKNDGDKESKNIVFKIIVISFIILGLWFLVQRCIKGYNFVELSDRYKTFEIDEITKVGQTGDLLMFAEDHYSKAFRSFRRVYWPHGGADWSHSGILYIDPLSNIPYVWEALPVQKHLHWTDVLSGNNQKSGAQLIKFHEKMETYKGHCCLMKLTPSLHHLNSEFLAIMDAYKNVKFNLNYKWISTVVINSIVPIPSSVLNKLRKIFAGDRAKDGLLCTELTVLTYYYLGAWSNDDSKSINDFVKKLCVTLPQNLMLDERMGKFKVQETLLLKINKK